MRISRLPASLAVAALLAPTVLPAYAGQQLHELVEAAWQRSPLSHTLAARQDETAAARALSGAWLAGAPTLGLSNRSGRWAGADGGHESEVSLSAPVLLPGQKEARRQLALRGGEELDLHTAQARLAVAGDVRRSLWEAVAAREVLTEKQDHLKHMQRLADDVRRRASAGELARSDALLADQEVYAATMEAAEAASRAAQALMQFHLLTGAAALPELEPEALPASAATPPTSVAADSSVNTDHGSADAAAHRAFQDPGANPADSAGHVRLLAATAAEARARAALALATSARQAPPTVTLSARRERDTALAASNSSIGLALQIPLGGAGRNRPAEAQAGTQLATASAELAQARASVAAELRLAAEQLGYARQALDAATARAKAQREHTSLYEKAFRLGEKPLADLLRSQALSHDAEVAVRQRRVALALAHAQMNQAQGIIP